MQRLKEIAFHMPLSCSALARDSRQSVCSEPPVEMLSKKPSCVECACLNSAYRQAKTPSSFCIGQALQLPMENNDPQALSKFRNGLKQRCAAFAFAKDFFW